MTFYEKVNELCFNRGTSITAVAVELGYSQSLPTTWKNSKGLPRANTLRKLSDYFGVPISYFCNDEKAPTSDEPSGDGGIILSDAEKELLEKFRRLSAERQELAIQLLAPLEGGQ
jgi:transcriptional regulator with XRE-family HTH domain